VSVMLSYEDVVGSDAGVGSTIRWVTLALNDMATREKMVEIGSNAIVVVGVLDKRRG
jgi:hypothetical protein